MERLLCFQLLHQGKQTIIFVICSVASNSHLSLPSQPNYPGRSSHLCNAGFIVPPQSRGLGIGGIAGKSFVHYGPLCGYRGSVFNLVYANNEASIRIWERLGFTKVGLIPQAGLLKTANGQEEDYVDAWVIYGDFRKLAKHNVDT